MKKIKLLISFLLPLFLYSCEHDVQKESSKYFETCFLLSETIKPLQKFPTKSSSIKDSLKRLNTLSKILQDSIFKTYVRNVSINSTNEEIFQQFNEVEMFISQVYDSCIILEDYKKEILEISNLKYLYNFVYNRVFEINRAMYKKDLSKILLVYKDLNEFLYVNGRYRDGQQDVLICSDIWLNELRKEIVAIENKLEKSKSNICLKYLIKF